MSPRPRFTTRIDQIRNAVLGVLLRPLRWFSPRTQFVIGFISLALLTTAALASWPFTNRTVGTLALVTAGYFIVWQFVKYRTASVDLLISRERVFALMGSAIFVEAVVVCFGFLVMNGIAAQSTRPPFANAAAQSLPIPFAAAALLVGMLLDRQLSLFTGVVTALLVAALA